MNVLLSVFALALLLQFSVVQGFVCSNFNSHMGATFDLHELQRQPGQPSYAIEDGDIPCTPGVESNYTYDFNICGTIPGAVEESCKLELGDKLRTAAAIQINKRDSIEEWDDWCFAVGYYNEDQTSVRLLDERDPSKGLKISYKGDYCNGGKQRMFNVELSCTDKLNPIPTHAYELAGCEYTVYMPSVYGCPLECPVANRQLCGGQGHCSYDLDSKAAHCFCNRGYGGADCTDAISTDAEDPLNYSPALLGLIITLFVIIGLLVCGVFVMIKQVGAYRDDIANYQVLKGGDEPDTPGAQRGAMGGGGNAQGSDGVGWVDSVTNVLESVISPLSNKVNEALNSSRGGAITRNTHTLGAMDNSMNSMNQMNQHQQNPVSASMNQISTADANRNTFTPPSENTQSVNL